ncbi:Zn-dependent exopeptidase, partial [Amylocystis lapponica]
LTLSTAVVPLAFLLVTPPNPAVHDSCLSKSYYGLHGQQSVFITDEACISDAADFLTEGTIIPLEKTEDLVWLEQEAVDEALRPATFVDELDDFLEELAQLEQPPYGGNGEQQILEGRKSVVQVLSRTPSFTLIAIDPSVAVTLDMRLPRYWKASPLPIAPVPLLPVPSSAIDHVRNILASVKFDPDVASIVHNISTSDMFRAIRYLTGEDPASPLVSRHALSQGAVDAAGWLKAQFEETGAHCVLQPFLRGFSPNVVCQFDANTDTTEIVLLSAHYDSRGSFGSTRAPGGDDDGSGTIALLSIARVIARKGITFNKNVQFALFSGEEQGLYGSKYYARELRAKNANLTLMIQADMIGYHAPGEPPQLGLPASIGTPEVAQLVANLSAIYSPELTVGITAACCSDHQSFHEQGFPSTQVFERAGPIADPMYHNSGDLSEREGFDFNQIKSIAKIQFATLLHSSKFELAK